MTEVKAGGATYALLAYGSWGLVPLYWHALRTVPASEILGHRIVWSTVLLLVLIAWKRQAPPLLRAFGSLRTLGIYTGSALLIGVNWGIYIFAVTSGHVLESSLGYFINPLVNVALGVAFLGERLGSPQKCALGLAALGVCYLVASAGVFPWIALSLSATFGVYGLVRKVSPLPSLLGSSMESLILTPAAALSMAWFATSGTAVYTWEPNSTGALLIVGGAVTALPLLWFSEAARRMPLITLGFFQFLSPTLQFLLAVFAFGEPFTVHHAVSFVLIWSALVINVTASFRAARKRRIGI